MTGPELAALAKERGINPYFLAYALATGAQSAREALERDGDCAGFLRWNTERLRETRARIGLSRDALPEHADHLDTLAACIPASLSLPQMDIAA